MLFWLVPILQYQKTGEYKKFLEPPLIDSKVLLNFDLHYKRQQTRSGMHVYYTQHIIPSPQRQKPVCAVVDFDCKIFVSSFNDGVWSVIGGL